MLASVSRCRRTHSLIDLGPMFGGDLTGAELLLFGAILYPGGRTPTRPLDVLVVLKGPVQPMIVREKQKIAGIWMNADSNRFRSAPDGPR